MLRIRRETILSSHVRNWVKSVLKFYAPLFLSGILKCNRQTQTGTNRCVNFTHRFSECSYRYVLSQHMRQHFQQPQGSRGSAVSTLETSEDSRS